MSKCLYCQHEIDLGPRSTEGQKLICPECQARLEVVSVDPPELDWAYDQPTVDVWDEHGKKAATMPLKER